MTYFALILVLLVAIVRRSPMPSEESTVSEQFEQLTKRIKSLRHVFAAAMILTLCELFELFDVLLTRGDGMQIMSVVGRACIFLAISCYHQWRVMQCLRLQRQLCPATTNGSPLSKREVGK